VAKMIAAVDGKFKLVEYPDGRIRLTLLGGRYAVRGMWFDDKGGNIMMMPLTQIEKRRHQ